MKRLFASFYLPKPILMTMLGTGFEYFDLSLYGFMALTLAKVFLPALDPFYSMMLVFILYPLELLSRPLGALLIGHIGDKLGRRVALRIAIGGMSLPTLMIACLPTYDQIGLIAPILFAFLRIIQNFFIAGEFNGGAIYILEQTPRSQHGHMSGIYCCFTVLGIVCASLFALLVSHFPSLWRLPFVVGALIGLLSFYYRHQLRESPEFIKAQQHPKQQSPQPLLGLINKNRRKILQVILVSFLFGGIYSTSTLYINNFVPLVTPIPHTSMMYVNVLGLIIYFSSLPLFGKVADRVSSQKSMAYAALCISVIIVPIFLLLPSITVPKLIALKTLLALSCAWYIAPFHALVYNIFPVKERYRMTSLSYSLGSRIGNALPFINLWLWHKTQTNLAAAFLLSASSLIVVAIIWRIQSPSLKRELPTI